MGTKALSVNPLKHSAPLGGALAFLGMDRCMPVLHGSQGCASFAKALLVRHFREPIPLQTSAITELDAILGGGDNLVAALANVAGRHRPDLIGVLTTGLTEARGDDLGLVMTQFREEYPQHGAIPVVTVSTPDFVGGLQEGYAATVEAMVEQLGGDQGPVSSGRVNLLLGPGLSPLDGEEVRDMVEAFGLEAMVLPELSRSLDGHLAGDWSPLTGGGTRAADLQSLGSSAATLVVGACLRRTGEILRDRFGVPLLVYERLTGLGAVDRFVADLSTISGRPVPQGLRRWRMRLADGMLDAHFTLGGEPIALALEPDLLYAVTSFLEEMGAEVVAAVTPTRPPIPGPMVGDYEDLEAAAGGARLLIAGDHGGQSARRLGIPHFSLGFPVFERLGHQYQLTAGYRGSLDLLFGLANCIGGGNHQ